tara:strand:+ start:2155 stop:2823 length:669 start_codon:yes stop_codon:yes gene_type:complete
MNFFDNNNLNQKKMLINNNMVDKYHDERSLKNRCVDKVRTYNKNYKDNIVNTYRNYLDIDDDNWCAELPQYKDVVIGYIKYRNAIIPYTEETSIDTFHYILKHDDRFEFVGADDDLTFQYLFSFLTSVGFLQPRDIYGNKLFDVVSIFNGFNTETDIECFIDLTQVIQKRYRHEDKHFNFNSENIKPIMMTATRKKLSLKKVADCLAIKKMVKQQINDCVSS